ncbi:MAG: hypothetical protein IAE79_22270 [Anaerolinea sp.]|nr:hypothetical protein [Anaerolinea sp.]
MSTPAKSEPDEKPDKKIDVNKLQYALTRYFSSDALRQLCVRLEVNYDDLREGDRKVKIKQLVQHYETQGQLLKLLNETYHLYKVMNQK